MATRRSPAQSSKTFYGQFTLFILTMSRANQPLRCRSAKETSCWADGTLLTNGARGWLPTNYCTAYNPEEMSCLLKALLNFWDLMRSTSINDNEIFGNQEFMKGIIAGVRYLLVGEHIKAASPEERTY
jgi:hypothetical protein